MGFSISWLAIRGKNKVQILEYFGLVDTGETDEANESPISGAQLPEGWYIMFFNDLTHPFVEPNSLATVSADCVAVACQVEEHVMASSSYSFENGTEAWSVTHEFELGPRHLVERGHFPDLYSTVKPELTAAQDQGDRENEGVDYIWDIPVTLAYQVVGYRHDRVALKSGGEPYFTSLAFAGDA
jgi:hypothetical protein